MCTTPLDCGFGMLEELDCVLPFSACDKGTSQCCGEEAMCTGSVPVQGCLYGGSSEDGPRGDAWLFDAATLAWERTAENKFGDFEGAAKAWQAAAVLEGLDVRNGHMHQWQSNCPLPGCAVICPCLMSYGMRGHHRAC